MNQTAERRDRHRSIPDPAQDTEGQRRTAENAGPLPRRTRPEDDRKNALSHRTEAGIGGCSGEEFEKEGYIDQPRRVWHSPGATLVRYYDAVICLNNSANLIKTYKHYMLSANPRKVPQGAFKSGIKILGCSNSD